MYGCVATAAVGVDVASKETETTSRAIQHNRRTTDVHTCTALQDSFGTILYGRRREVPGHFHYYGTVVLRRTKIEVRSRVLTGEGGGGVENGEA